MLSHFKFSTSSVSRTLSRSHLTVLRNLSKIALNTECYIESSGLNHYFAKAHSME